jgi:hypothetical protein
MRPDKWPNDVRFAARMRAERWAELTGLGTNYSIPFN